jgi:hypothetical protein
MNDHAGTQEANAGDQALQNTARRLHISPRKMPINSITNAAPKATKEWVRMPADLWCFQRFSPRVMPASKAKPSQV